MITRTDTHQARTANASVAGFTFLLYIAVGISQMVLFGGTTAGEGIAAKLASMAQNAADVRINVVLGLLTCFMAFVLGVTLYRITHDQGPSLAMMALTCRVGEGVIGCIFIPMTLGLLSHATAAGVDVTDTAATHALGSFLLEARGWYPIIGATFFAVGSTLFSYLLLRGRTVPVPLAWLGVVSSIMLVLALPAQLAGVLDGAVTSYMWLPMAVFEVVLALWLLIKGVAMHAAPNVPLKGAD